MSAAGLGLTLQYAHLNQPQTISAPANVKPFSQFESKLQGVLAEVQGATGGAVGSGSSASGSTGSSGSSATTVNKYTKCIENAGGDVGKMQKCASLLNAGG